MAQQLLYNFKRTFRNVYDEFKGRSIECIIRGLEFINMESSQKKIIAGIIMPNNWDETGRIIEIAIYTYREEVYTVERNELLNELMNFMYQSVEIKGRIREYPDGRKSIVACNYVPFKEFLKDV